MTSRPFLIASAFLCSLSLEGKGKEPISVQIAAEHFTDGIFPEMEPLSFEVLIKNSDAEKLPSSLNCTLTTDEGLKVSSQGAEIAVLAESQTKHSFSFKVHEPGFYRANVQCKWEGGQITETMQFGYAPTKLNAPLTKEPDFQNFWDKAISELKKVDPRFETHHRPRMSKGPVNVYEVKMRSLGGVRVRGWYEVPKKPGPFPAALRVPGYGQNMKPAGLFKEIALFSFNVRGHGNSQEDIRGEPENYWVRGLEDEHNYYYRGAYMDCVRAMDFLCSRKEVDIKKIAVFGGSQGGGLSFATAALDKRVSLCAPIVPFLANWDKYFKTTDWPEMNGWIEAKEERTWKTTLKTLSYFDSMNLATLINCPLFMGVGLQDPICPPSTNFAAFNQVKGQREYRVYPNAKHSLGAQHQERVCNWIRKRFGIN